MSAALDGIDVRGPMLERFEDVLTPEALAFVARLHREFNQTRERLLQARRERQAEIAAGTMPDFLPQTRHIRESEWTVAPLPRDLADRKVEITGPTDRKMIINALNSGASVYMADFEDANTPTWSNMVGGQVNLIDAVDGTITFTSPDGKTYRLGDRLATLLVRPRGWHLPERHLLVDGQAVAGAFFDFGLYVFHNARRLLAKRSGPYFYLPKLESHLEARLWNDVFAFAEDALDLRGGTIKGTVLVETILGAFEMDEILYELRDHAGGLNAGRWDYIFSIIKKFAHRPDFIFPDRAQVTMTVPFMRAYTQLLVRTCHRRGAHALGGMAAFIPSRRDAKVNETAITKVREDKVLEAGDGFDGTWVAHPDLVPVAMEVFTTALGDRPNQLTKQRPDVQVTAEDLLAIHVPGGRVSEAGLRNNISVALQYLESWLRGTGAVGIFNLMEDAATAEIARAQVWQWVHYQAALRDGPQITRELVERWEEEELARIRDTLGAAAFDRLDFAGAHALFDTVALNQEFVEFLTLPGYARLD